jgi:hypothetical protein
MICRRFFKDRKSDHGIVEEKQEVCMDREMNESISKAQGFVDDTNTEIPRHGQGILGMHKHIQGRFRWCFDARWSSDRLHFKEKLESVRRNTQHMTWNYWQLYIP